MIEDSKTDFEVITDFGNLYQAYKKSKSGKGFNIGSQKFQLAALDGIHQIKRRLETKTYNISKYNEFIIYEPKERIIKAGSFQDKIVQHSLCDNALLPKLKTEFIDNNFAGQIGIKMILNFILMNQVGVPVICLMVSMKEMNVVNVCAELPPQNISKMLILE